MPEYRAFVTYPTGQQQVFPGRVLSEADRNVVLKMAGDITRDLLGITPEAASKMSPARCRELAAKVECFRVAKG